jgi:hypothetical protein
MSIPSYRCSQCQTPVDLGQPDTCGGCGAPLQKIPATTGPAVPETVTRRRQQWRLTLGVASLLGLMGGLFTAWRIFSSLLRQFHPGLIDFFCDGAVFAAAALWILQVGRSRGMEPVGRWILLVGFLAVASVSAIIFTSHLLDWSLHGRS